MNNDRQTGKWSYSTSGKVIRGFVCMLTYCVFIAGLAFCVYGMLLYGIKPMEEPKRDYFETAGFQTDIANEVSQLIGELTVVYDMEEKKYFSITNANTGVCNRYDIISIMADYFRDGKNIVSNINELNQYRIENNMNWGCDFRDYGECLTYIKKDHPQNSYLYFDRQMFKDLFYANGIRNTNYRFSDDFSEYAWFVFDCGSEALKEQPSSAAAMEEFVEERKYDLDTVDYAVYDEKSDVFYSPADDYFAPMDQYIYNIQDLRQLIEDRGYTEDRLNSLVLPLLKSVNVDIMEVWVDLQTQYDNCIEALDRRKESRFCYMFRSGQYIRKNVDSEQDIVNLDYAWRMTGKRVDRLKDVSVRNVDELSLYNQIENAFQYLPDNTILYFGINMDRGSKKETSALMLNYLNYQQLAGGLEAAKWLALVAFVLLMLQAGWLIRTTGKKGAEDREICLNGYDKIGTELWFILYLAIPAGVTAEAFYVMFSLYTGMNDNVKGIVGAAVLAALPFGFVFMQMTLSLARRIKAHNLKERMLIVRLFCRLEAERETFGEDGKGGFSYKVRNMLLACFRFFENLKGTNKLLAMFVVYVFLNGIVVIMARSRSYSAGTVLLIFILLQGIAMAVIVHVVRDINRMIRGVQEITQGNLDSKVDINKQTSLFNELADGINHIGDGLKAAVETSLKDERMKTELITNVSHDLKTPLTSIINYINLLKTQKMSTPEAEHYVEVLEGKAQRLRHLTEDLVEAAKATSGNIELEKMPLAFNELMKQALGEFEDKFKKKNLTVITYIPEEPAMVLADGRRMYRILENVLQNVYKYAMEGTRVYAELSSEKSEVIFILKNVSAAPLNISPEELMERFTRGDSARTTEGSGLGLSIARDLTRLQGGRFEIRLDGDLFKVIVTFPELEQIKGEG